MSIDIGGSVINSVGAKVLAGTGVVTSGLTCYLDAGIPASYPGSGTTWTDLSGNGNNGTLVGGVGFSGLFGGVLVTDGVDDYIDITSLNYSATNCTVMGAARYLTTAEKTERIFSGLNNNWLMGHWQSSTRNYFAVGWVTGVGAGPLDTNFRVYATTNNVSGDSWGFYVNGVLDTQNSNGSQGPNGFSFGRYAPANSEYSASYIASFLTYNRLLSDSEIIQNYNALRGRLGI